MQFTIFGAKEIYVKCKIVKIKADLCTKSVKWSKKFSKLHFLSNLASYNFVLHTKLMHFISLLNMPMLIMTLILIIMLMDCSKTLMNLLGSNKGFETLKLIPT